MVSQGRLDWLINQIHGGRSSSVRFSYNHVTRIEKVSFSLEPYDGMKKSIFRLCVMGALQAVHIAMSSCIVTDKGHRDTHRLKEGPWSNFG